jgi:hypothetical protein
VPHELGDQPTERQHEHPGDARHDVAVVASRPEEPQGQSRCREQAEAAGEQVSGQGRCRRGTRWPSRRAPTVESS